MMKNRFVGFAAFILVILMILPMLTACGDKEEPQNAVTVEVDGEKIVIDNPEGKPVAQLLEENEIVLGEGDVAVIDLEKSDDGFLTVKVLRKCTVTVEDKAENQQYTAVIVGGTVEDAIKAVGIKLSENQKVNHELKAVLEDGMKIVITVQEPENDDEGNNTAAPKQNSSSGYSSGSGSGSGSGSNSSSSSGSSSGSDSGSTSTSDSGSSRSVVSTENYDDPDGSGHGVRVITYSDGSQEEVEY